MNETTRRADVLILLVGSNPLPNYLAALVLSPKQIFLFYSPETKMVKQSLQDTLRRRFPSLEMEERCIGDVTHAAEVREAFPPIQRSKVHLHYTGGTKIMAAHARMAFRDAGGTDAQASYLNERRGVLRFDDGYELDLAKQTLGLTLEEILSLHAIQSSDNKPKQNAPTEDDAKALAQAVFQDPSLAQELYQIHRDEKNKTLEFKKAKGNAVE